MRESLVTKARFAASSSDTAVVAGRHCLSRAELWQEVDAWRGKLEALGARESTSVAVQLPPSVTFVAAVLAVLELGAQVVLLHHRLTQAEYDASVGNLDPRIVVRSKLDSDSVGAGFLWRVPTVVIAAGSSSESASPGVVQFTSGSTGLPQPVLRTITFLEDELNTLELESGWHAGTGDVVLVLNSLVHSFGLIGGVLCVLRSGGTLAFATGLLPRNLDEAIRRHRPNTITGVPAHFALLGTLSAGALDRVTCCVSGGQLMSSRTHSQFVQRHGVGLGQVYGLTELGLVAADFRGDFAPAVGKVCRHHDVRVEAEHGGVGEVWVRCPVSPYLDDIQVGRWRDGWLATRDVGRLEGDILTVLGRLDSQVAVGGLKVNLTDIEDGLLTYRGVTGAVVLWHAGAIHAFVESESASVAEVRDHCVRLFSPHKRPRLIDVCNRLPRTASGKLVRDLVRLMT